ncbi:MAG: DUF11 domain-containing protein, partial [Xanthomonadales bacterium]|nr:DUF11 domain-containing protein [Xanthomonadales bacterium]
MVAVTSRAGAFLFGSKFRSGRVRHALTGWSLLLLSLLFATSASAQQACALPGSDPASTASGIVNTYYAGPTGTLAAGATQLTLGARNAQGPQTNISVGDLLLVIQMQDGVIDSSNNANYGSGTGVGTGTTDIANAGNHEFVVATSAGGVGANISFSPGLSFSYTTAAATVTRGQRRYQVIRVPQYAAVTANGVEAALWNGVSGGVVALDVRDTLTLGSATVEGIANRAVFAAGRGFRGAAGINGTGGGTDTAWRAADGTIESGITHGGKGEGIAGTPRYIARKTNNFGVPVPNVADLVRVDNGAQGYPQGDRARGAPGNAGGGGTDGSASSASNSRNAGGGGGGNYAQGGFGGRPWNAPLNDTNGRGGAGYASVLAFNRAILGGGGGSGGTNNATDDANTYLNNGISCGVRTDNASSSGPFSVGICSSGASGGGLVILRARNVTGTGVIDVRGAHGYNVRNDAAGGGGAGGTVVLHTVEGGTATVDARGGDGGNAWAGNTGGLANRHGPGGGGGGGFVAFSPASMALNASVGGGTPGYTTNGSGDTYESGGNNGGLTTFQTPNVPGVIPGAECAPDLILRKSNGIDIQQTTGSTTYSLTVTNQGAAATFGSITVVDVLPVQLSVPDGSVALSGPQAANWSCNAASGVITCTSAVSIPGSGTSSFAFNALVSAANGSAIINRARVGGGGDPRKPVPDAGNTSACSANDIVPGCAIDADTVNAPYLQLSKSSSGGFIAGGSGSYSLTVTNIGSQPTSGNFRVVDVLPVDLSFATGFTTTGGFSCSHAAGVVTCNSTTPLAPAASASISFDVTISASASSSVVNRAAVGGGGDPIKPGLPTSASASACPAPVPPATQASSAFTGCASVQDPVRRVNLSLAKTDNDTGLPVNGQTTYVFTVSNSGDAASVGTIFFRDELPAPMTWSNPLVVAGPNAGNWSCTRNDNNTATCTSAVSIPAGGSSSFSIVANVNAATNGTEYVNHARIGGGGDPDLLPGAPTAGQTNACTGNNTPAGCALDLGVAQSNIVQLRVAKSHADPQARSPGDTVGFNLLVTNSGNTATSGQMRVVDVIPVGMAYTGAATFNSGGFSCTYTAAPAPGFITCNRTTPVLAAGASTTISFNLLVQAGAGNSIVNRTQIAGGGDSDLGASTSVTSTTAGQCAGSATPFPGCAVDPVPLLADLFAEKLQCAGPACGTAYANYSSSLSGSLLPGTELRYLIRIGNNGAATVSGATVSDTLPVQMTAASIVTVTPGAGASCAPANVSLAGNVLSGTIPSLPAGGFCDIVISTTASTRGVNIPNTANVGVPAGIVDPTPGNNQSTVTTSVSSSDVVVVKDDGLASVTRGGSTVYAITVTNYGPDPATSIQVVDNAPAGTSITAWSCTGAACPAASGSGNINQTISALAVGASVQYSVTLAIPFAYPNPTVANTATATPTSPDPNTSNNTSTDTDNVVNVTVTKALTSESITSDGI